MEPEPSVLDSLRAAVTAMPDDVPLRVHLATLLLQAGQRDEAVRHLGAVLQQEPGNAAAIGLLTSPAAPSPPDQGRRPSPAPSEADSPAPGRQWPAEDLATTAPFEAAQFEAPEPAAEPRGNGVSFDWSQAEDELRDVLPQMFVDDGGDAASAGIDEAQAYSAERAGLTLADVAGMTEVKARLEAAFLAPMRNPELRKLYHKSLRGGLLLYGPPGCGKTFVARAVAGELGAQFITVSFADLIDRYVGQSERNIHQLFDAARRSAPCVLFLDEVDAIGQKRSQLRNTPMRSAVNQLLLELDDVASDNTGVFLLAATNHPWDVDSALRRPGRFDRTLLVLPPDGAAREGVFRFHLRDRPVPASTWDASPSSRRATQELTSRTSARRPPSGPCSTPSGRASRGSSARLTWKVPSARYGHRWARGSTRRATSHYSPTRAARTMTWPPICASAS